MRIAVISDIHGNLTALEAVLTDIAERGITGIYHLGDLVGYGPWPNEVVARIEDEGILGVAGNYDSTVAYGHAHCGCQYDDPRQQALSLDSFRWTVSQTAPDTKRALGRLPFRLDVRPLGGHRAGPRLVLIHGASTLNTVYWREDRPESFCRTMLDSLGSREGDAVFFGHTHIPWSRSFDGRLLVNTGSVGRPKDGDPRAGYAVIDVGGDGFDVEIIRVPYDVERTARAIESTDLPSEFAQILRTGGSLEPVETGAGASGPQSPPSALPPNSRR